VGGPEQLAFMLARVVGPVEGVVRFVAGWQAEVCPAAALEDVAGEVAFVGALHDDDLDAGVGVVEAGGEGAIVPVDHAGAGAVAAGLFELVGVVDDDHVAALACRLPADSGRDAVAGRGVLVPIGAVHVGLELDRGPVLLVPG
jgi:hypothetical protein